jgi:serine/threonine-protein kinase
MPPVPARIGRYSVQRVLGRGGMGTVYLAVDPLIEREVAIKVLPLAGADEYGDRLIAEARVSGRLIHPHIVGVFDIGEADGQPFVVMPYVSGRTLAAILTDSDRPPLAVKLRWMVQLCDALAYAHERRVIHRDVKPSNLLIDEQGNLRVLDFGIAKVLTTSQITSVGTPTWRPSSTRATRWIRGPTCSRPASCSTSSSRTNVHFRAPPRRKSTAS